MFANNLYFKTLTNVLKLLRGKHRRKAFIVLMLSFTSSVIEVVGLAFVIPVIYLINDPAPIHKNGITSWLYEAFNCNSDNQFILYMMLFLLVIFIFKNLFAVFIQYIQSKYSYSISYDLLTSQLERFYSISFEDYLRKNPSYFVREIAVVPNDFSINIFIPLIMITNELLVLSIIIVGLVLFKIEILGLLAITILPVVLITMGLTKRRAFRIGEEKNRVEPEKYKRIYDNVNAFLDIRIYEMEKSFIRKAVEPFRQLYELYVKTLLYQSLPQRIMEVVVVLTIALAFYLIVFILKQSSETLVLTLALFATAAYRVMPSADRIMKMLINIRTSEYIFDILKDIEDHKGELDNLETLHEFERDIELSSLSYSYQDGPPVLRDIDLHFKKGDLIGLVGDSGSGKTTLARILVGLIRSYDGVFRIDGNQIDPEKTTYLSLASLVQQDFSMLNLSLAENIAYGMDRKDMDEARIGEVLKKVGLGQFASSTADGIWMEIKDGGKNLSGGQKQRIAIARALYRGKQLLVLDESTNALDEAAEKEIIRLIHDLSTEQGLTTVIITHNHANLSGCDAVYSIREGKLNKV